MEHEIQNPLGKRPIVHYKCPACGTRLKSPLTDAGSPDACPNCGTSFNVPGADGLKVWSKRQADERESTRKKEDARRADEEQKAQETRALEEQHRLMSRGDS